MAKAKKAKKTKKASRSKPKLQKKTTSLAKTQGQPKLLLGEPRRGSGLSGRESLLKDVLVQARKKSARRRHMILTSPRKCGRSSLLAGFAEVMGKTRGTRLVSLNFNQRSLEDLIEHFLCAIALGASAADQEVNSNSLPDLIAAFPKRLAELGREMQDLWERWTGRMSEAELLERCLGLPELLQKGGGGAVWVVCDHFEGLVALVDEVFLAGPFRECLGGNRQVRWLLSGTPPALMERLTHGRKAPLAGQFEVFVFRGLAYSESLGFLQKFPAAGKLPQSYCSFLVALTGGHPFYLEVLADGLERSQRDLGSRVGPERLLVETLTRELFAGAGRLHLYFNGLLGDAFRGWRAPDLYLGMVEAVARGQSSLVGICHFIRRAAPALSRQVQNLLDSGLVAKEGTRYFIPDLLFRLWLRHVYLARRAPRRIGDTGLESFQKHFQELLSDFLESTEVEIVRRIARILSASDGKAPLPNTEPDEDESMPALPRFDQVEMQQKVAGETFDLVARRGNDLWLFVIFKGSPREKALSEFAQRVGQVRKDSPEDHLIQAVALALNGFSRTARRATDRLKLGGWGIEEVNALAECYGQLPIV